MAILLPFVLVTGYGAWLNWSASRALDRALARAKAVGLPVTAEELNAAIPPDSENAAVEYEAADALYRKLAKGDKELLRAPYQFLGSGPGTANMRNEYFGGRSVGWSDVAATTKRLDPYFKLITAGSKKPRYHKRFDWRDYPYDFNLGLKVIAFSCNSAAEAAARTGDPERGLRLLESSVRIANHQKQQPDLLSALQGLACDHATLSALRALALLMRDDQNVTKRLVTIVTEIRRVDYRVSLRSEAVMNLLGAETIATGLPDHSRSGDWRDPLYREDQCMRLPWIRNRAKSYFVGSVTAGYALLPKTTGDIVGLASAFATIDRSASSNADLPAVSSLVIRSDTQKFCDQPSDH